MVEDIQPLNDKLTRWQRWCKDLPQERALYSGILVMLNSGINLSWTLSNVDYGLEPWARRAHSTELVTIQAIWFVGAIVGGFNAGFFIDSLGRRSVIRIGIAVQLISAIISIFSTRSMVGLIFSRVLGGYGYGCAYLGLVVYAGEISLLHNRGKNIALLHLAFTAGFLIFSIMAPLTVYRDDLNLVLLMGIISGVLSLLALPINHIFTYESPVALIRMDMDLDAQETLVKLRNERLITVDIREEFRFTKEMVERDTRCDHSCFKMPAFYFMIILKIVGVALLNYPLNHTRIKLARETITSFGELHLQLFVMSALRFLMGIVIVLVIDRVGRRRVMQWSVRVSAIAALVLAVSYVTYGNTVATVFNFAFEIFTSMGILMCIDVWSAEAFITQKKGVALSLVNCFENLLQMVLIVVGITVGVNYVYSVVMLFGVAVLLVICSFLVMPETKKLWLAEATNMFVAVRFSPRD